MKETKVNITREEDIVYLSFKLLKKSNEFVGV